MRLNLDAQFSQTERFSRELQVRQGGDRPWEEPLLGVLQFEVLASADTRLELRSFAGHVVADFGPGRGFALLSGSEKSVNLLGDAHIQAEVRTTRSLVLETNTAELAATLAGPGWDGRVLGDSAENATALPVVISAASVGLYLCLF